MLYLLARRTNLICRGRPGAACGDMIRSVSGTIRATWLSMSCAMGLPCDVLRGVPSLLAFCFDASPNRSHSALVRLLGRAADLWVRYAARSTCHALERIVVDLMRFLQAILAWQRRWADDRPTPGWDTFGDIRPTQPTSGQGRTGEQVVARCPAMALPSVVSAARSCSLWKFLNPRATFHPPNLMLHHDTQSRVRSRSTLGARDRPRPFGATGQ